MDKLSLRNLDSIKLCLRNHYLHGEDPKPGDLDEPFIQLFTQMILNYLETNKLDGEHRQVSKDIFNRLAMFEQLYFDQIISQLRKDRNLPNEFVKPELKYISGFGNTLSLELLRKRYFYQDLQKDAVSKAICEKVLKEYAEQIQTTVSSLKLRIINQLGNSQPCSNFLRLMRKWEEKQYETLVENLSKEQTQKVIKLLRSKILLEPKVSQDSKLDDDFKLLSHSIKNCKTIHNELMKEIKSLLQTQKAEANDKNAEYIILHEIANNLKNKDEKNEIEKAVKTKPDITEIRRNVLKEINILDHNLNTLVELYNNLIEEEVENKQRIKDLKRLFYSLIKEYREVQKNLSIEETTALIPIASIRDCEIFKAFLAAFLEDFEDDILFEPKKAQMLSLIFLNAIRFGGKTQNKSSDIQNYCSASDLVATLKIMLSKLQNLTLDPDNLDIQEAMNSLNDLLFIMSFIGVKGLKEKDKEIVEDFAKLLKSPDSGLKKFLLTFFGNKKSYNQQTLSIKADYAKEALKRIEDPIYQQQNELYSNYIAKIQIGLNIARGCLGDISCFKEALIDIIQLIQQAKKDHQDQWYEEANELRIFLNDPFDNIKERLIQICQKPKSNHITFYVIELLLSLLSQINRTEEEKNNILDFLIKLVTGQNLNEAGKSTRKQRGFFFGFKRREKAPNSKEPESNMIPYVRNRLINIAKESNEEFRVEIKRKLDEIDCSDAEEEEFDFKPLKQTEKEDLGRKFYVHVLLNKQPRLYALAKIQTHSQETLDIPKIYIELKGIKDTREFDDAFKTQLKDKLEKLKHLEHLNELSSIIFGKEAQKIKELDMNELINRYATAANESVNQENGNIETQVNLACQDTYNFLLVKIKNMQDKFTKPCKQILDNFLKSQKKTVLLIQGDAGAGKSLLLRIFEQHLWREYNGLQKNSSKCEARLPLRISLSEVGSLDKAVEEFLSNNGCNYEAIQEIKNSPVIILFDGYDELTQSVNIFNKNKLNEWKDVKVVITSRKEAVHSLKGTYKSNFYPGDDRQKVASYVILPVDRDQRQEYFTEQAKQNQKIIKMLDEKINIWEKDEVNDPEKHQAAKDGTKKTIEELKKFNQPKNYEEKVRTFKEILTSPFMLKILVETIPKFTQEKINRAELYRLFTTQHFEREQERILNRERVPPKINLMESFYQYSKDLAINMHMKGVTSIQIRTHNYQMVGIRESKKENIWSRFFDDRDRLTKLARLGAQIIEDDGVVRFLHKSIMEYFAARTIFDEILDFNPFDSDYDFCIDKGSLIDTDKAVFKFFNEIQSSQPTLSTYNDTLFDRKLFEIFNNSHIRKRFSEKQINIFDIHQLLPNLFLTILRRNTVIGMIRKTGTGSVAILNIIEILNWACSESDNSNNFIDALQFVLNEDQQFSSNLKSILEKCYQEISQNKSEYKESFVNEFKSNSKRISALAQDNGSNYNNDDDDQDNEYVTFAEDLMEKIYEDGEKALKHDNKNMDSDDEESSYYTW